MRNPFKERFDNFVAKTFGKESGKDLGCTPSTYRDTSNWMVSLFKAPSGVVETT